MLKEDRDVQAYLARIRRTIAESENLVSQAELRIAETDRMLESQGLTREQVLNLKLSGEQRRLVDEELKRRGLPGLEEDEARGAPPELTSAAKDDTSMMSGIQTPTPVSARSPTSGICPI